MKRTLFSKLLTGYLLYCVIGFLIISTLTYNLTYSFLEKREASNLYRESVLISSVYAENYFTKDMSLEELQSSLASLSTYLSSEIWLVDAQGTKLLDTSDSGILNTQPVIDGFNLADFGNRYYMISNFYDSFSSDTLSVYSPITVNYRVRGYVFIHKPMSNVVSYVNDVTSIAYQTFILLLLTGIFVLLLFLFLVYKPIRKIAKGAQSFAKGNWDTEIDVHSNDEIGYLAASMNYMANELNTLEDDQRKFISNVSHDFRSPLTSIKGYVEAILDGTIPPEMQEKYLNIILFETERLNKLTKSILELNRYGSHGIMLDIARFDINHTIRMTVQTFEGICKSKHISFHLLLTGDKLYTSADMSKIQQVLYNLIDNAIKFSNAGSFITMETTIKNDKIFVSIKDSGIGIPKDSIQKIWERFYKTDLSRGKDKKGTGLGLSIVKEIIQAHNENITVISTEGVGTEFIFTLPLINE